MEKNYFAKFYFALIPTPARIQYLMDKTDMFGDKSNRIKILDVELNLFLLTRFDCAENCAAERPVGFMEI